MPLDFLKNIGQILVPASPSILLFHFNDLQSIAHQPKLIGQISMTLKQVLKTTKTHQNWFGDHYFSNNI